MEGPKYVFICFESCKTGAVSSGNVTNKNGMT